MTIMLTIIIRLLAAASIKPQYLKLVIQEQNTITHSNFIINPLVITIIIIIIITITTTLSIR